MDVPDSHHVSPGGYTGEIPGLCHAQSHGRHCGGIPNIDHKRGSSGLERIAVDSTAGAFHVSHGVSLVYEDEKDLCGCNLR